MLAFTLCSNNYLAQAAVLSKSFALHNPDIPFVVGLVDRRRDDIDYDVLGPCEVLEVEAIGIPFLDEFLNRYDIVELNTAVKPFYFAHFFEVRGADAVFYLDPDIEFYQSVQPILDELGDAMVLLTPHILSPAADPGPFRPQPGHPMFLEPAFLVHGAYNLGFVLLARQPGVSDLLDWWKARTSRWGYRSRSRGLFVDQLWMSLAPALFDGVRISRNPGLNVAYWNVYERALSIDSSGSTVVNRQYPLVFFHFSSFDPRQLEDLHARSGFEVKLGDEPRLGSLATRYSQQVLANGFERLCGIEDAFAAQRSAALRSEVAGERRRWLRSAPFAYAVHKSARFAERLFGRVASRLERRPIES